LETKPYLHKKGFLLGIVGGVLLASGIFGSVRGHFDRSSYQGEIVRINTELNEFEAKTNLEVRLINGEERLMQIKSSLWETLLFERVNTSELDRTAIDAYLNRRSCQFDVYDGLFRDYLVGLDCR
ncbi:MAG: hypothetical protein KKH52_04760, partial [Nanoarchaeota archaeon]|nr:hypothetical protein [Nanoarchaeota archaeon]